GSGVGAAGERAGIEDERVGDGRLRLPGEGAVDVELELAGRALAVLHVRLSGRLELEPERVLAWRQVSIGFHSGYSPDDIALDVAELAFPDEQGVSAGAGALGQQYPLGAFGGNL